MILSDVAAERAVLAGICQHGEDAYYDVVDYVKDSTFDTEINKVIFKCLKHIFDNNDNVKIDIPTIYSAAQDLKLEQFLTKTNDAQHLNAILNLPVELSNVCKHAAKIRKLEIANLLHQQLGQAQGDLLNITGGETITHILGIAEDAVFNFTSLLDDSDEEPTKLGDGLYDRVKYLEDNPVEQIGISTGFSAYDFTIGGGLRPGTINIIAARTKVGKSIIASNIAYHIAKNLNIPVFNLDTEMLKEDIEHRMMASMTEVKINDIETGRFAASPDVRKKVYEAVKTLESVPYFHKSIAGKALEDQISITRKWITKEVGLNEDGTAKDCVLIYDYLKLMDSKDIASGMKEYQALGFLMSTLHNFAVRYKIPILALLQLNRDGILKEGTETASGSDRIVWLASNFSILKDKSDEEIADDGRQAGNKKIITVVTRHGAGLKYGDYINCHAKMWCAKIVEGKTKFELEQKRHGEQQGGPIEF